MNSPDQECNCEERAPERRSFLKQFFAAITGGIAVLIPAAAGLRVYLSPLSKMGGGGTFVKVATLDALPDSGAPRKFAVKASKQDAWNKYPNAHVGTVYLRKLEDGGVQAINVICPHAGCFVDYEAGESSYKCPCHNSSFSLDGGILNPASPSPRPLDSLEVEIREGFEVWVKYQNFLAGHMEKVPA